MSTVSGACWEAGGEKATSTTGAPDVGSASAGEGTDGGTKTYVVVASEDGAVRFYDLKFRVEVSAARHDKKRVRILRPENTTGRERELQYVPQGDVAASTYISGLLTTKTYLVAL